LKKRTDHYASFKDPSARVFFIEDDPDHIYRELAPSYVRHYKHLLESGLASQLFKKKWLIPFEEIKGDTTVLRAAKIRFVSYPYEWTFSQWKEAAMLTMKIQYQALKHGMILKDATPFNIVFDGQTPVFIDISSFEVYEEGKPWPAFLQFSENFYMPLLLYKYFDSVANDIYLSNSNGISLAKGLPLLPWKAQLSPSNLIYLTMPAKIRRSRKLESKEQASSRFFTKQKMLQFADQLFNKIKGLRQASKKTRWNDYYSDSEKIDVSYLDEKLSVVKQWIGSNYAAKTVIDVGCNTGNFSKPLTTKVGLVIAFDDDSRSVDELYQHCRENKITNIFSFTANISSSTPATGWSNFERASLIQRLKGDVTLALALIHHLCITYHARFEMVRELFSRFSNELFIEFVPPEDDKVQLLMAGRQEIFSWYNWEEFLRVFGNEYTLVKSHRFQNNRILVHFIKKDD
jgi:hypothetical protein